MPSPAEWFGLCARSESDRPHEWIPLLTVMRNRLESKGYPDTAAGVVLQRWQFSYFNDYQDLPEADAYASARRGYAGDAEGDNSIANATAAAEWVLSAPRWMLPFGPRVLNFWSPCSMKPAGKLPKWGWDRLRVFSLPEVDPWRWLYGEDCEGPEAGNVRRIARWLT